MVSREPSQAVSGVEVGQFAIERGGYSIGLVGPISKVTAAQVQIPHPWRKNAVGRVTISQLIFWGTETACRSVLERITSSKALNDEERRSSAARHKDREAKIIASGFAGHFDLADTSDGKEFPGGTNQ